ncbi:MAG: YqaJ viral recombinase family protein [Kiloniellales bacterium]|nr:YqaJ viral recombinase family protein [Kiloniellales bacterium]
MLSAEELEARRAGIGSSDIAAIAGGAPFDNATPMSVWNSKVFGEHGATTESMIAGSFLEDGIGRLYQHKMLNGTDELTRTCRTVHPDNPWMFATPDRLVVPFGSEDPYTFKRIVEIKMVGGSTSLWDPADTEGIPAYVRYQIEWQMACTGMDEVDVAAFFLSNRKLHVWRFAPDLQLREILQDVGYRFWTKHVLPQVPPSLDFSEATTTYLSKHRHPKVDRPEIVDAPEDAEVWVRAYENARQLAKRIDAELRIARAHLCDMVGDAQGIRGDWGRITWAMQRGRVNWEAVARDLARDMELPPSELDELVNQHRHDPFRRFACHLES